MSLTAMDYIFVGELLLHDNAAKAFRAARPEYNGNSVTELAWRWRKRQDIVDELERCKAATLKRVELTVEDVVRDIRNVLCADSRDITEYRKGACRYCHGTDHQRMRTPEEHRQAYGLYLESEAAKRGLPFDHQGGVGYSPKLDPHPECPECHGDGIRTVVAHDTRTMNEAAATLYAGTKPTANGIEIITRSKDQARKDAAAWLGMNKSTLDVTHTIKAAELDDDALAAIAMGAAK